MAVYRDFAVALASGALIGVERGWVQRDEVAGSRVAGVRTFALLGILGGMIGLVGRSYHPLLSVALMIGTIAILLFGHIRASSGPDEVSATMFVAELLTLCFGLIAVNGYPALAIGVAAVTTLILALRTELHGLLARLGKEDVKALARFAIITAAILPFLPNTYFGPYDAWNPRQLWLVVVLVTGFSFAGYIANRLFGARLGILATSLIGGAYSSTAVTTSLSRRLRSDEALRSTLSAGIALASAIMFIRVLILTVIVADFAFLSLLMIVWPALTVTTLAGLFLMRRAAPASAPQSEAHANPVEIIPALGFLLLVAILALATRWGQARFGDAGAATLILIAGAFDVDAAIVTLGGLSAAALGPEIAGQVLAGAVLINMIVKLCIVVIYAGWKRGRLAILSLLSGSGALGIAGAARHFLQ